MWLIGVFVGVVVIVILLMIVLYAQSKGDAQGQGQSSVMYMYSNANTQSGHSFYEHSRGGQRPFGENSRTRRSEREKARSDRFFY